MFFFTSGLTYAESTKDFDEYEYNYSSDEYLNSDEYNSVENYSEKEETPNLVSPIMISEDSEQFIDEGQMIKLPCVVDKLGIIWKY